MSHWFVTLFCVLHNCMEYCASSFPSHTTVSYQIYENILNITSQEWKLRLYLFFSYTIFFYLLYCSLISYFICWSHILFLMILHIVCWLIILSASTQLFFCFVFFYFKGHQMSNCKNANTLPRKWEFRCMWS